MEKKVENIIEKIIKLRLDNIIEKSEINTEIGDKIRNINENIKNENKIKNKKVKNIKKDIPKDDKKMNSYTLYIKDATNVMKENPNLNYLSNDVINKVKTYKDKKRSEQFKEFSIIWNGLSDESKNKYKKLCHDKNFTNIKYNEIIGKKTTPKIPRKKKSKDSLKK